MQNAPSHDTGGDRGALVDPQPVTRGHTPGRLILRGPRPSGTPAGRTDTLEEAREYIRFARNEILLAIEQARRQLPTFDDYQLYTHLPGLTEGHENRLKPSGTVDLGPRMNHYLAIVCAGFRCARYPDLDVRQHIARLRAMPPLAPAGADDVHEIHLPEIREDELWASTLPGGTGPEVVNRQESPVPRPTPASSRVGDKRPVDAIEGAKGGEPARKRQRMTE